MTIETRIQTVVEAQAVEHRLATRIDKIEREIDAASSKAAQDFAALAEGAPVNSGNLAALQAELTVLEVAHKSALEGIKKAARLEKAQVILERHDKAQHLLEARAALGKRASEALDAACAVLDELRENGNALVPAVGRSRGVESAGPKGFNVFDARLLDFSHVQHLLNIHLKARVLGWKYDTAPTRCFLLDTGISDANSQLRQELDLLFGGVADEDVAAIRAAQSSGIAQPLQDARDASDDQARHFKSIDDHKPHVDKEANTLGEAPTRRDRVNDSRED
jgi:hypothetical protein